VAEDEMIHPYREFAREQTLRLERAFRGFSRELREQHEGLREELREQHEENRGYFQTIIAELRDLREENRAQTQALLRILDRLDNGPAPAT
jgi:hypothetical protein